MARFGGSDLHADGSTGHVIASPVEAVAGGERSPEDRVTAAVASSRRTGSGRWRSRGERQGAAPRDAERW